MRMEIGVSGSGVCPVTCCHINIVEYFDSVFRPSCVQEGEMTKAPTGSNRQH